MNAGKFAIPGMMIVRFGSIGSSWFYGLEFNERYLTGMRWDSSAKDWGALVTLAGDKWSTERVPTSQRPADPTEDMITTAYAHRAAADQKRVRDLAAARTIAHRLKSGETVKVTHETKGYDHLRTPPSYTVVREYEVDYVKGASLVMKPIDGERFGYRISIDRVTVL